MLLKVLSYNLGIRELTDDEEGEYFDRLEYLKRRRYKERPVSADEIERETRALDDRLRELTQSNAEFANFEGSIRLKYGIKYYQDRYSTFHGYVSSLFLVDMLEQSFIKGAIRLPNEITALDVGAGEWSYCVSLLRFLEKFEGERKVKLIGVDYDGKNYTCPIQKMTEGLPVTHLTGNVMHVPKEQAFDLLFVAHMVYSKYHCKEHKVPYIGEKKLFGKFFELLKPHGLHIMVAYNWAGEDSIFDKIPKDKLIVPPFSYHQPVKSLSDFFSGRYSFSDNHIGVMQK